ncbi:MAG: DUF928 domain-containing protein [Planctomycetota bacterium]
MRGAPNNRVAGGSRGDQEQTTTLSVLLPEHPGHTTTPQPRLYWYLSKKVEKKIEIALIEDGEFETTLELSVQDPDAHGVMPIDLGAYGVTLKPKARYQLIISIVLDPMQRSRDIIASGALVHTPPSAKQKNQFSESEENTRALLYAEQGYWCDALDQTTRRILSPQTQAKSFWIEQRAALFRQVGLKGAAAHDLVIAKTKGSDKRFQSVTMNVSYKPLMRGAPKTRLGSGSRSDQENTRAGSPDPKK